MANSLYSDIFAPCIFDGTSTTIAFSANASILNSSGVRNVDLANTYAQTAAGVVIAATAVGLTSGVATITLASAPAAGKGGLQIRLLF
jgi:hypothetical protein